MKTEVQIQQENLNTLLTLMKENPTLRVIPMVESEVVQSEDYSTWAGSFGKARIDDIWCDDERIYFKYYDEEDLIETEEYNLSCNEDLSHLSDEEVSKMAEENVKKIEWEKVIVVEINTP
ncbi:MAG: hypothetical protein ACRC1T_17510 [Clostridium chrysemydis]|uniref:hypothetical protein n=1 Tax=Clostridium chrysemydis TaxID=2665504 RepID=UPI003F34AA0C